MFSRRLSNNLYAYKEHESKIYLITLLWEPGWYVVFKLGSEIEITAPVNSMSSIKLWSSLDLWVQVVLE